VLLEEGVLRARGRIPITRCCGPNLSQTPFHPVLKDEKIINIMVRMVHEHFELMVNGLNYKLSLKDEKIINILVRLVHEHL